MTTKYVVCTTFALFVLVGSQQLFLSSIKRDESELIWCTVNSEERSKCEDIGEFLRNNPQYDRFGRLIKTFNLSCIQTFNKDECMLAIDNDDADITTLDPGEVFVGGRYNSLVPILQELYNVEGLGQTGRLFSVTLIRKSSSIRSLRDLRGKKACFGGVGSLAGWIVPVSKLMKEGGMEIKDCNNHVKSVTEYFGSSCAVNSLSTKYNPLGDNSDKLCEICGSELPGVKCTSNDLYAGYQGAIDCLMDKGDVAFVKHSSVQEYFEAARKAASNQAILNQNNLTSTDNRPPFSFNQPSTSTEFNPIRFGGFNPNFDNNNNNQQFGGQGGFNFSNSDQRGRDFGQQTGRNFIDNNRISNDGLGTFRTGEYERSSSYNQFLENFELLCQDGSRRTVEEWKNCFWDELPSHAVVTSSGKTVEMRERYQNFVLGLERILDSSQVGFSSQNVLRPKINLFQSVPRYGNRSNLLFQDATVGFKTITEEDQTYAKFLGKSLSAIMEVRSCPVAKMTLCVTSDPEFQKCIKMRTALNAQLLKPEMSCYKAYSQINCMEAIRKGDADAAVMDAGDIYTAGYIYDLIPVLSEIYNLKAPEYYAVAVAYQGDADTELTYLKGKYSCHSGVGHAAGWVIPMAYLISSGRMRNYGCDSLLAASQYFTKSCVPGALSNEFNFGGQYNNLCDLCRGSSFSYCSRHAGEDFFGYTGALRCLIEGWGQVAFVKHTTVSEVTDGKRREHWARNTLSGDYELLCRDGTRAPVTDYERCNLGKVKANAVVIRGGEQYNDTTSRAIINLFLYAQQLYGSKFEDDFKFAMFYSPPPYSDLIFQDAAQQLQIIPQVERNYRSYLGKSFLRARALVDCRAFGSRLESPHFIVIFFFSFLLQVRRFVF